MSDTEKTLCRPIIVLGAPRSGTTVLSQILEAHPDLVLIGEPRLTWRYGNERKSDMLLPEDARPPVRSYIRRAFARELRRHGGRRLLEKSPSNSLRVGFVDSVFPDSRIVHIIRDGRDSAVSIREFWHGFAGGLPRPQLVQRARELTWRRAPWHAREVLRRVLPVSFAPLVGPRVWGPRIPGLEQLVRELDLLAVCCLQWRTCVEAACHQGRALPAGRYLECRLEDFSPELVRRVLAFCDLEEHPDVLRELERRFDASRTSSRRELASEADAQLMREWLEPTLQWLGYGEA